MTDTSRGIKYHPSSKNTPSSAPYCIGSKRKSAPHEKINDKLTAISSISPLVIDDDLKMGDMRCGFC